MATVWFTSDWHLGHKNILNFAAGSRLVDNLVDHDRLLFANYQRLISKRCTCYFLGDIAFYDLNYLDDIKKLNGRKFLVRGNHDNFSLKDYANVFDDVFGIVKYKQFWLSHAPVHPEELRGKRNIHGHVHGNSIMLNHQLDNRYINVCPEVTAMCPMSIDQIRNRSTQ